MPKWTPRVGRFMTPCLHAIGSDETVARAREIMQAHGLPHLPVVDGGKLVGILTARDLNAAEALDAAEPSRTKVGAAMSLTPFVVTSDTPLEEVAAAMAAHQYTCAVVTDHGAATGVFSTIDSLRTLATILRRQRRAARSVA